MRGAVVDSAVAIGSPSSAVRLAEPPRPTPRVGGQAKSGVSPRGPDSRSRSQSQLLEEANPTTRSAAPKVVNTVDRIGDTSMARRVLGGVSGSRRVKLDDQDEVTLVGARQQRARRPFIVFAALYQRDARGRRPPGARAASR